MTARIGLLILTLVIVFVTTLFVVALHREKKPIEPVKYNLIIQDSLEVRQGQTKSTFQLTLILMGALWATLLAKKDESTFGLSDLPEIAMFALASLLLLASLYFHLSYLENFSDILWKAGKMEQTNQTVPDFFNSFLNDAYRAQIVTLIGGILCSAIHLINIYKVKP